MTSSRNANVRPASPECDEGTGMKRGSTSGTLTRANFVDALILDDHGEALAAIRNIRKRMPGIERQRRQHRADVGVEMIGEICLDLRAVLRRIEKVNAGRGEERPQFAFPAAGDVDQHPFRARSRGGQLFAEGQPVRRDRRQSRALLPRERRHTDHEELVEIVRGNRQELDALQQRMAVGPRLIEHPLVERQPTQLAIDVEPWIAQVWRTLLTVGRGGMHDDAVANRPILWLLRHLSND